MGRKRKSRYIPEFKKDVKTLKNVVEMVRTDKRSKKRSLQEVTRVDLQGMQFDVDQLSDDNVPEVCDKSIVIEGPINTSTVKNNMFSSENKIQNRKSEVTNRDDGTEDECEIEIDQHKHKRTEVGNREIRAENKYDIDIGQHKHKKAEVTSRNSRAENEYDIDIGQHKNRHINEKVTSRESWAENIFGIEIAQQKHRKTKGTNREGRAENEFGIEIGQHQRKNQKVTNRQGMAENEYGIKLGQHKNRQINEKEMPIKLDLGKEMEKQTLARKRMENTEKEETQSCVGEKTKKDFQFDLQETMELEGEFDNNSKDERNKASKSKQKERNDQRKKKKTKLNTETEPMQEEYCLETEERDSAYGILYQQTEKQNTERKEKDNIRKMEKKQVEITEEDNNSEGEEETEINITNIGYICKENSESTQKRWNMENMESTFHNGLSTGNRFSTCDIDGKENNGKDLGTIEGNSERRTKFHKKKKKKRKKLEGYSNIIDDTIQEVGSETKTKERKKNKKIKKRWEGISSLSDEGSEKTATNKERKGSDTDEKISDEHVRGQESNTFKIVIEKDTWREIKPKTTIYGKKRREIRKLMPPWTDVFASKTNEVHKGCVLRFKNQHVRQKHSRKQISAPFIKAHAYCLGERCGAKYTFTKQTETTLEENVSIMCTVEGQIYHGPEEVNRRNKTGKDRKRIAEEIRKSSSSNVYYDFVRSADTEETKLGNFTSTPNPTVLRKIISEQIQKENFHQNIVAELQIMKENYEKEGEPFIRDIGLDPFCVIMFSQKQVELVRKLSSQNDLNIYLDATGSVIRNIKNQKRPYLYSIVVKPDPELPPVSIADMLSTEHTIPRIELFLGTTRRAFSTGKGLKIKKNETDYSLALIQATLRTHNCLNIKTYLKCLNILLTDEPIPDLTVLHLCSAHMMRDFMRQLNQFIDKTSKQLKHFIYSCYSTLLNVTTLKDGKTIFRDMCVIFLSNEYTACVQNALKNIEKFNVEESWEDPEEGDIYEEELYEPIDEMTIREASPFNDIFKKERTDVEAAISARITTNACSNNLYCPGFISCLMDKFMYLFPMWTGVMLNLNKEEEFITRDTNANVENWFKSVKHDIGIKSHARPSKFIIALRAAIYGRIQEMEFPGSRRKKTKKGRKRKQDEEMEKVEEIWKKGKSSTKKPRHAFPEKEMDAKISRNKSKVELDEPKSKPKPSEEAIEGTPAVPKWGGKLANQTLINTCTIDNCLTILHLCYTENENFQYFLQKCTDSLYATLLTVFHLMTNEEFDAAKLVWVHFVKKSQPALSDLYGDETDYIVTFFDREWKSTTSSTCSNISCPEPYIESRAQHGVNISLTQPVQSLQGLVSEWLKTEAKCHVVNSESEMSSNGGKDDVCHGLRKITLKVANYQPVLFLRVYEHCRNGNIDTDTILNTDHVKINTSVYVLAGVTMHRRGHYCAVVKTAKYGLMWYDGLVGQLQTISDVNTWAPCHVVFCRVH